MVQNKEGDQNRRKEYKPKLKASWIR